MGCFSLCENQLTVVHFAKRFKVHKDPRGSAITRFNQSSLLDLKKLTHKRSLTVNKIRTNKLKNIWLTLPANYFAEFKIDQKTRKLG